MKKYLSTFASVAIEFAAVVVISVLLNILFAGSMSLNGMLLAIDSVVVLFLWIVDATFRYDEGDGEDGWFVGPAVAIASLAIFWIVMLFTATPISKASAYSETGRPEFVSVEDIELPEVLDELCLMDSKSALSLARRKAGEKAEVVSQFDIDECYTQVLRGKIVKIVTLKYAGVAQTYHNDSIPYYIMVDPVNNTAELVAVDGGIRFAPCDYWSQDLVRHLRKNGYRTALLGDIYFNVDEDGHPFWTVAVESYQAGMLGCRTPIAVVMVDAVNGDIIEYTFEDVPQWVDGVISGDTATKLYRRYGRYNNGFMNLSKVNETTTTADFGYLQIENSLWYYTGVTSMSGDESNIGFLLVNSRTLESKYYTLGGAEEFSAMAAAEGVVQNYGYKASFPSLVMVSGEPTYVMVLKDTNGLVKAYAMVNYKNYTIVSVAETITQAKAGYITRLGAGVQVSDEDEITTEIIVVSKVIFVVVDGNTICYIKDTAGHTYKTSFTENLVLLEAGDTFEVKYIGARTDITTLIR